MELLFKAGRLPISTVGEPGIQGAAVMGMQGMGTSAPMAAAVAAATIGLAIDWHMPKGSTLTMGLLSMMLAAGVPVMTRFRGRTMSEPGIMPKVHCVIAPVQTCCPMFLAPDEFLESRQQAGRALLGLQQATLGVEARWRCDG